MTSLISDQLWHELKRQAKETKRRSCVAVAYLSPGAFRRLPLRPGSLLVVNCNETTVRGGQTDPREVLKYLEHGVMVYNVSNLHAKVFVLGSRVFVGSSNVSSSSEGLLEAAIVSKDRSLVQACKTFVRSLVGEAMTPAELDRLIQLYDPKRFKSKVGRRGNGRRQRRIIPQHNPIWAVRTVEGYWQEADYEAEETSRDVAIQRLSSDDFKMDDFRWHGHSSAFFRGVREGDVILRVHEASPRKIFLQPPEKVVLIKRYKRGKRLMVFVERRKRLRQRSLSEVQHSVPAVGKLLMDVRQARMIRDATLVHDAQQIWAKS